MPSEVWQKAFHPNGKPRQALTLHVLSRHKSTLNIVCKNLGQRTVLRHLFEVFVSAGENWLESSIVLNARRKNASRRRGKFIWITFEDLAKKYLALNPGPHVEVMMISFIKLVVTTLYCYCTEAWRRDGTSDQGLQNGVGSPVHGQALDAAPRCSIQRRLSTIN